MAKFWEDRKEDSGKMYEVKFMGKPTVNPEFFTALKKLPYIRDNNKFRDAVLETFEKYAVDDPQAPPGDHLRTILEQVQSVLCSKKEDLANVRAYSTLHIPEIDVRFGVDGFIEYVDPKSGKKARVTIDATLNREKLATGAKADLLVGELPDAVQDEDAYFKMIEKIGGEIASELLKRTLPEERKAA